MKAIAFAMALLALSPSVALAQGAVVQAGPVVRGHSAVWGGPGSLIDGGSYAPAIGAPNTWTGLNTFSAGAVIGGTLGAQFQSLVPSTFSSTVGIAGNTTVAGTLGVTGATTLGGGLTLTGALASSGGTMTGVWGGSPSMSGNWTFLGNVALDGSVTLSPTDNITIGSNLGVVGTTALGGGGSLGGSFSGAPNLTGALTLSGTPNITNGAALSGTFSGSPSFSGDVIMSGSGTGLSVTNGAAFNGGLTFTGGSGVNGSLSSNTNFGIILRGASGALSDVGIQTSDGNVPIRAVAGDNVQLGPTTSISTTQTLLGATAPTRMGNFASNYAGSSSVGGNTSATFQIGSASDALALSGSSTLNYLVVSGNQIAGYNGSRVGVYSALLGPSSTGTTLSNSGLSTIPFAGRVQLQANLGGNTSGFGTTSFGLGNAFGMDLFTILSSGATAMSGAFGAELDMAMQTGSSASVMSLLQLVLTSTHAVQGTNTDQFMEMAAQTGASVGARVGLSWGRYDGQWGFDPKAYLDQAQTGENYLTVAAHAAGVIDAQQITLDGSGPEGGPFLIRGPGASGSIAATAIDGLGGIKLGGLYISATNAALTVGSPLFTFNGVSSIGSGGSGYTSGDVVTDGLGNVFTVTASAGVVSAVTLLYRAEGKTSAPSVSGLSFISRTRFGTSLGSGLTVTENAWTQAGYDTILGPGTNLPVLNATTGFAHLPFTNATSGAGGVPTGTPANISGPSFIWNEVTGTLNVYSPAAGAWKHVTLSAGAG